MKKLVIDKRAVKSNLQAVKDRAGSAQLYADLSADAYGLGLLEMAKLLREEGVHTFAISDPRDAALLRTNSFTDERIMMLRSTADSEELSQLIELNVVCTVGSYDAAVALNGLAESRGTVCEVQIKVDTGLGRYGFTPEETDKIAAIYKYMSNLAVVGTFTTLHDRGGKKAVLNQLELFGTVLDNLHGMGYETGVTHAADDMALLSYGIAPADAVRVGLALSGRLPGRAGAQLIPVGYIAAGLEEVGWFPKGHHVSGAYVLSAPAKLGVLSVGYYHGFGLVRQADMRGIFAFLRARRSRRTVRVGNQRALILGEVGMMHTIIDVTKINCAVGEAVILDIDPINVKGIPRVYRAEKTEDK